MPWLLRVALAAMLSATLLATETAEAPGATRIATWQDDRKAAFLLMFDDGWPSHWQVAVPELEKRGLIATFYVNPAKGEFAKFPKQWAAALATGAVVLGNHTMTHQGAATPEAGVKEIGDCQAALYRLAPGKEPRLFSFGMPGVKEWKLPKDQHQATLTANHLIDRPTFSGHGAVYHLKTSAEMLALADKAIAAKGMEYLVVHGVERLEPKWGYQDFWALKQDVFLPVLDGLKERRDRGDLWITDHVTWHQYQEERRSAQVAVHEASATRITLALTCSADPAFYDCPLTLVTQVPAGWSQVLVVQGGAPTTCTAAAGAVRFRARPGADPITLTPAP